MNEIATQNSNFQELATINWYSDELSATIKSTQLICESIKQLVSAEHMNYLHNMARAFADHMSGMIRDIYEATIDIHAFTRTEKNELLASCDQHCRIDSEKSMLLQILAIQEEGILTWERVGRYFLDVTYKSGERDMETNPKRTLICHGIQTNYNNPEMVMKLLLCVDILVELAWRVKKMREESEMIIDIDS